MDQIFHKRAKTEDRRISDFPSTLDIGHDEKMFTQFLLLNQLIPITDLEEVEEIIDVEAVEETEAYEEKILRKTSIGFNDKPKNQEEKNDNALRFADTNHAKSSPRNVIFYNDEEIEITTEKESSENNRKKEPQIDKIFASGKTPPAGKTPKNRAEKELDNISVSSNGKNSSLFDSNKKKYETRSRNKPPVSNYQSPENDDSQVAKMADRVEKPGNAFLQKNIESDEKIPLIGATNDKTDANVFPDSTNDRTTKDCNELETLRKKLSTNSISSITKQSSKTNNAVSSSQTKIEESVKPEERNSAIENVEKKNKSCKVSIPIDVYKKYLCSTGKSDSGKNPNKDRAQNKIEDTDQSLKMVVFFVLKKEKNATTKNLKEEDMRIKVKIIQKYFESYLDSLAAQSGIISKFVQENVKKTQKTENTEIEKIDQAEDDSTSSKHIILYISKNKKNKDLQGKDTKMKVKIIEKYYKSYLDSLRVSSNIASNLVKDNIKEIGKVENKAIEAGKIVKEKIDQAEDSSTNSKHIIFYISKSKKNKDFQEKHTKMKMKIIEKYYKSYLNSLGVLSNNASNSLKDNIKETEKVENKAVEAGKIVEKIDQAEDSDTNPQHIIFYISKNNKNKGLQEKDTKMKIKIIQKYYKSYLDSLSVPSGIASNSVENNIEETEKLEDKAVITEKIVEEMIYQPNKTKPEDSETSSKCIIFHIGKNTENAKTQNLQGKATMIKVKILEKYYMSYLNSLATLSGITSNLAQDNINRTVKEENKQIKTEKIEQEKIDQATNSGKNPQQMTVFLKKPNENETYENVKKEQMWIKVTVMQKYYENYLQSLEANVPQSSTTAKLRNSTQNPENITVYLDKPGKASKDLDTKIKVTVLRKYYEKHLRITEANNSLAARSNPTANVVQHNIKKSNNLVLKKTEKINSPDEDSKIGKICRNRMDKVDSTDQETIDSKEELEIKKQLEPARSRRIDNTISYYQNYLTTVRTDSKKKIHQIVANLAKNKICNEEIKSSNKEETKNNVIVDRQNVKMENVSKEDNCQDSSVSITDQDEIKPLSSRKSSQGKESEEVDQASKINQSIRTEFDQLVDTMAKFCHSLGDSQINNSDCDPNLSKIKLDSEDLEAKCDQVEKKTDVTQEIHKFEEKNEQDLKQVVEACNDYETFNGFKSDQKIADALLFDIKSAERLKASEENSCRNEMDQSKTYNLTVEGRKLAENQKLQDVAFDKTIILSAISYNKNTQQFEIPNSQKNKKMDEEKQEIEETDQVKKTVEKVLKHNPDSNQNFKSSPGLLQDQHEDSTEKQAMNNIVEEKLDDARQELKSFQKEIDKKKKIDIDSSFIDARSQNTTDLHEEQDQETQLNTSMATNYTNPDESTLEVPIEETSNSSVKVEPDEDLLSKSKKDDIHKDLTFILLRKISDDLKEQLDRSYEEMHAVHRNFKNTIEAFDSLLAKLSEM